MIIDTHCHIDLYENPMEIANESERLGIITIGMTNLPSHFEMGKPHLRGFKKVRLALGMHPLYAEKHLTELPVFFRNVDNTSYIGEIGLDFSMKGISTREIQIETFTQILKVIKGKNKILSIHSRMAEREVLNLLVEHNVRNATFHWSSGSLKLIDEISKNGFYFSINPAMIRTKSGKAIIKNIPLDKILTESDGPFISVENKSIMPKDIYLVHEYLSEIHRRSTVEISEKIRDNFSILIKQIIT
jgi:TatD DNase family protein